MEYQVAIPDSTYWKRQIKCQDACPVHTDARGYVRAIAAGDDLAAYLIARGPNPFASICGRICGAPCEAACRRGDLPLVDDDGWFVAKDRPIAIRALKRFVCEQSGPEVRRTEDLLRDLRAPAARLCADADEMAALLRAGLAGGFEPGKGQRVAIIGAGPAGLSAAHDLALMGFGPVVFESESVPAGMLELGVPAYRLPRHVIEREIDVIRALGVEVRCGVSVGEDVSFAELRRDFAAVVIAVGAKSSRSLGLPGESGPRVYGGVDMLRAAALGESMDIGREVLVIGGGNVAYDVARTVIRQIAYDTARTAARMPGMGIVHLASLETLEEMPADTIEIHEGDEEGIRRLNGWGPLEIQRDATGSVTGVLFRQCQRVYDEQRRFSPVFNDNVRQIVPCDTVLLAVGQATNLAFLKEGGEDIEQMRPGWPKVDPTTLSTSAPGVFVAGDLAHGTRLLIDAVASGKRAARSIYQFITGRSITAEALISHVALPAYHRERGYEALTRVPIPVAQPAERMAHPDAVVEKGYGRSDAVCEASRCLDCGVLPVFDGTRCVLCGGCVDVCPTQCLKLVSLSELCPDEDIDQAIHETFGEDGNRETNSAILKDDDRCIRCALCAMRCPVDAITMERTMFSTSWRN